MVTAFMLRSVTDLTVESNGCLSSLRPQSEQDCVTQPSVAPPGARGAVLRWEYRDEWLDDGVLTDAEKALIEQHFRDLEANPHAPSPEKKPRPGSSLRLSGELPGASPLCRLSSGSLGLEQRLAVNQGLGKASWENDSDGGFRARGSRKDRARMQSVTILAPTPPQTGWSSCCNETKVRLQHVSFNLHATRGTQTG